MNRPESLFTPIHQYYAHFLNPLQNQHPTKRWQTNPLLSMFGHSGMHPLLDPRHNLHHHLQFMYNVHHFTQKHRVPYMGFKSVGHALSDTASRSFSIF